MKTFLTAVLVSGFFATATLAAAPKTYQVTGPVLEVTDTSVVVQKGKDKWEIARDASTPVKGELKVGSKVTVEYRMTATDIEVKGEAAAKVKKKK